MSNIYALFEAEGIPIKRPRPVAGYRLQRQDEDEDGETYMTEPEDGEADEEEQEDEGEEAEGRFWELMEAAATALNTAIRAYRRRKAASSAVGVYD